ncbi:MAG: hypothetical protein M1834_006687 [Cirrosporium novae-zelandiae]|nr:MAG: hypothetical protein M1834_006687 [Cirrosporium novae-zelandiae]
MDEILATLGEEITDAEEESFLLFSQDIPSHSLGILDPSSELDISVGKKDFSIRQSLGVLSSNRAGGTTGAVVWKVTPRFSEWISSPENILFRAGVMNQSSIVLELGCGISGLIALTLAPFVGRYILTDQPYVFKLLSQNIDNNAQVQLSKGTNIRRKGRSSLHPAKSFQDKIQMKAFDWELDSGLFVKEEAPDIIIACDCIYNEGLITPFTQTCMDLCKSKPFASNIKPTVCIIAHQLRTPEVFEKWLAQFLKYFRVWRVSEEPLSEELKASSGFIIHICMLKENIDAAG